MPVRPDGKIAARQAGNWLFAVPRDGMKLLNRASGQEIRYSGGWKAASRPSAPSGGAVIDSEARSAIAALLGALTTAGTMQYFSGSAHEQVLARALASASDHGITPEIALAHLRAGVQRYWLHAQRQGEEVAAGAETDAMAMATSTLPAEETERLRQLAMARRRFPGDGS